MRESSLVEQIEFYRHEYQTAETRDMAMLMFGAYMALCRAIARLEKEEQQ